MIARPEFDASELLADLPVGLTKALATVAAGEGTAFIPTRTLRRLQHMDLLTYSTGEHYELVLTWRGSEIVRLIEDSAREREKECPVN